MKHVHDFCITNHGLYLDNFYPGHSLTYSSFTDSATGMGATPVEALRQALLVLEINGWDTDNIPHTIPTLHHGMSETDRLNKLAIGAHYYVSIDVRDSEPDGKVKKFRKIGD